LPCQGQSPAILWVALNGQFNYFFDTSALGKYFHAEIGTATLDRLLKESGARHCISRLTSIEVVRMTGLHYQEAERLLRSHGMSRSLRTLDALQLSVTLDLRERGMLDHFVCADKNLCAVAEAEGLSMINPAQP
jgi:hypothetical protein